MPASQTPPSLFTLLQDSASAALLQEAYFHDQSYWMNLKQLASFFGIEVNAVYGFLRSLFDHGGLEEARVVRKIRISKQEGKRQVSRELLFYRLDAVIALGFRVQSPQASEFRSWITGVILRYMEQGFVLDDARLQAATSGQGPLEKLRERITEVKEQADQDQSR